MRQIEEFSYDIEQLYIEGHSPQIIAVMLGCAVEVVNEWLDDENLIPQGCQGYAC